MFVEAGRSHFKVYVSRVMVLARGDVKLLVLDDSIHLPDCEEDSARELVLVVDREPTVKDFARARLNDLGALQLGKVFLAEDVKVLGCLGAVAEVLCVRRRVLHLAEDILNVRKV